jgi:hypothetical protein
MRKKYRDSALYFFVFYYLPSSIYYLAIVFVVQ